MAIVNQSGRPMGYSRRLRFILTQAKVGAVAGTALLGASCGTGAKDVEPGGSSWVEGADAPAVSQWTVGSAPLWTLDSGHDGKSFSEVAGVAFDAGGDVLIADHRESRIHFVTALGQPQRSVGHNGDGPGELRRLDYFGPMSDGRVWAFDPQARRYMILGPDTVTAHVASWRRGGWPRVIGAFGDSDLIILEHDFASLPTLTPGSIHYPSIKLLRHPLSGEPAELIASLRFGESLTHPEGGMNGTKTIPFSPRIQVAVDFRRHYVYWGYPDSLAIDRWAPGKGVERVIAHEVVRRPIPPGAVADALRRSPTFLPVFLPVLARYEPTHYPAFGALLTDSDGGLWVKEYEPDPSAASRWAVFDSVGALQRMVRLPARFNLMAVRGLQVAGVAEGVLGEETVEVWTLVQVAKR